QNLTCQPGGGRVCEPEYPGRDLDRIASAAEWDTGGLVLLDLVDQLVGEAGGGECLALGRSRCERVDPDPVGREFHRPAASELLQCALAGRVVRRSGQWSVAVRAGDVHDGAAGAAEFGQCRASEEAGSGHVEVEQVVDL